MSFTLDQVKVRFGDALVLNAIDADIQAGRVTAILGANGAGKTTLLRLLAGLIVPNEGRVSLNGVDLQALPLTERARAIGYLAQEGSTPWNITGRELVGLGRLPHRSNLSRPSPEDSDAIDAALKATDGLHLAARTLDEMSGGERARLKLARVLAGNPKWILADEPLANLDPPHQRDMVALFRKCAAKGTGVIVVLHQINTALRIADDAILMRDGRILTSGNVQSTLTPETLLDTFGMAFDHIQNGRHRLFVPAA
jgi:iron complex transport system ATP-binding protein